MGDFIIEAKNLEKQYMKQKVLKQASFAIKKGSICGLVGPNGAGKTTIMKILGGLVIPTSGSYSIFGESDELGLANSRSRSSFIIETPYLKQEMSARDNLKKQCIQMGIPNKDRIEEVLEIVGLSDVGKKSAKNFSLGMKQRLGIAIALLRKPELLVLDEPVNGLDPEGIVEIRNLIKKLNEEEGITIVISSHILNELSLLCTDYIFINHGEIIKSITAKELNNECRESYNISTDNNSLACAILLEKLGIDSYEVTKDGIIKVFERMSEQRNIAKALFENGVIPTMLCVQNANLEEYYMSLIEEANKKLEEN